MGIDMAKVYIKSRAHCQSLGIEPCDSIIKTVIDTRRPREVLAYSEGHIFNPDDKVIIKADQEYYIEYLFCPINWSGVFFATGNSSLRELLWARYTELPDVVIHKVTRYYTVRL